MPIGDNSELQPLQWLQKSRRGANNPYLVHAVRKQVHRPGSSIRLKRSRKCAKLSAEYPELEIEPTGRKFVEISTRSNDPKGPKFQRPRRF